MRSQEEVRRAIGLYADTVKRICVLYLRNTSDTEDIFQEVFLKYALSSALFENQEHEKAWLIRVTINQCRDWSRRLFRRPTVPLEQAAALPTRQDEEHREVLYLHYYEGYTAAEIGRFLGKKPNTVYTLLDRGRKRLRLKLEGREHG